MHRQAAFAACEQACACGQACACHRLRRAPGGATGMTPQGHAGAEWVARVVPQWGPRSCAIMAWSGATWHSDVLLHAPRLLAMVQGGAVLHCMRCSCACKARLAVQSMTMWRLTVQTRMRKRNLAGKTQCCASCAHPVCTSPSSWLPDQTHAPRSMYPPVHSDAAPGRAGRARVRRRC